MRRAKRTAPYLSHFALREPPFAPAADSRFFYVDPARQQCLDMLLHLAEYSEEWLLVSGPSGVGKSRLLDEFCARSDPHMRPCRLDGKESVDGAQLFLRISGAFGLDLTRGDGNPLEALRTHLTTLHAEQIPVVAVDDADRLTDDALEIALHLAALEGDHGKLVRVILFAQAALLHRLSAERFKQLSTPHLLEIHPFDEGHTARYLIHRMSVAGYEGPNPFDGSVVRQIFRETRGVPGRINVSADQFLADKMADEAGDVGGNRTGRVIAPVATLAALALAGLLIRDPLGTLFGSSLPTAGPAEAAPTSLAMAPSPTGTAATAEPRIVQTSASALPDETLSVRALPEPATATDPVPPQSSGSPELPGTAWLEAQKPDHFTLQLLAATRRPTVRWFLETHPPEGPYAVVETSRNGTPLHVVVAGDYPNQTAALTAAHRLKGVDAWPRPFRELQSGTPAAGDAPAPGRN